MKRQDIPKPLKIAFIILSVLVGLVAVVFFGARLWFRIPVSDFYKASTKEFIIPGLPGSYVPQGLDYVESKGCFLISGYQSDGQPSRIYIVDRKSGEARYVSLADDKGAGLGIHAGGMKMHKDFIYVTGNEDPYLYVFDSNEVLNAADGSTVKVRGVIDTSFGGDYLRTDFICVTDDSLITGEFYKDPEYPTPDSHIFKTSDGVTTNALAISFKFSDMEPYGIKPNPSKAYALPELTQGMTFHDGKMWLSSSYSVAFSDVSAYDLENLEKTGKIKTRKGKNIPVYSVKSGSAVTSLKLPPMSEEIIFLDDRLYTMFESATNSHFFGKLTDGKWCYSTDVDKLVSLQNQ